MRTIARLLLVTLVANFAAHVTLAQFGPAGSNNSIGGIVGAFDSSADAKPATITAQFTAATDERPAVIMITAKIAPGWHVYSISQPSGGPLKTKIQLTPSSQYRVLGDFSAIPAPKSHIDKEAWPGLELQEHEGEVTWYAPIELAAGVDPQTLEIRGTVTAQVCKEQCINLREQIVAKLGPGVPIGPLSNLTTPPPEAIPSTTPPTNSASSAGSFQSAGSEVKWTGHIEPAVVKPGDSANVLLTATPPANWHIYAWSARDEKPGSKPTLLSVKATGGLVVGEPATLSPIKKDDSVPEFGAMKYHEGSVTWKIPVIVPADAKPGSYSLSGFLGYQACETSGEHRGSCELPKGALFTGVLMVGDESVTTPSPLTFTPSTYVTVAKAAEFGQIPDQSVARPSDQIPVIGAAGSVYDLDRVRVEAQSGSFAYYIALAFVGGLILNLMPCVLPVIGLKVMSFVQQAGHSRSHALILNLWYSLGIISVFLLLGAAAALAGLSWGGQFSSTGFNAAIAAVVFAMALSLLGVWEVPIPGFFGSGSIQTAAAQEGPLGAFIKGVITTILATPCTAPFMASALAWAVSQPIATTLAVFASLGLGMASPYLVVGVFPELLRFIPKPGAWMETFKQIMGFVLMGTVVFILSFMQPAAIVPTLALLLGVGLACWIVARTPLSAELNDRLQSWGLASAVVLAAAVASFGWLYGESGPVAWQSFSLKKLQQVAVEEGRTVLVDFSAEWCLTCKALERTVLHTDAVQKTIASTGAVPMYADFTDFPPEIDRTIKALKSNGVPVIAVFPGDSPYEPIVFRGGYTQQGLIDALKRAGSGRGNAGPVAEASAAAAPLN